MFNYVTIAGYSKAISLQNHCQPQSQRFCWLLSIHKYWLSVFTIVCLFNINAKLRISAITVQCQVCNFPPLIFDTITKKIINLGGFFTLYVYFFYLAKEGSVVLNTYKWYWKPALVIVPKTNRCLHVYIFPEAQSEWELVVTHPVFGVHVPVVSVSLPPGPITMCYAPLPSKKTERRET